MIFLKKYKLFLLTYHTNYYINEYNYGKVIWINELYISFRKYSTRNNSYSMSMGNGLLKKIINLSIINKKINGRIILFDKTINITYDRHVSYDIKIYDSVHQKMVNIYVSKSLEPYMCFSHKVLYRKIIHYDDFSNFIRNFNSCKWCVIV